MSSSYASKGDVLALLTTKICSSWTQDRAIGAPSSICRQCQSFPHNYCSSSRKTEFHAYRSGWLRLLHACIFRPHIERRQALNEALQTLARWPGDSLERGLSVLAGLTLSRSTTLEKQKDDAHRKAPTSATLNRVNHCVPHGSCFELPPAVPQDRSSSISSLT